MSGPEPTEFSENVDRILADYCQQLDRGESVSPEDLIRQHPQYASQLRDYFADVAEIDGMLTENRQEAVSDEQPLIRYFGDYQILSQLGAGGMGIVYLAEQRSLKRLVALKMIGRDYLHSEEAARRFQLEAEQAAQLKHPHIVAIHEIGEHAGQHYFSMDHVAGPNLAEVIDDSPLPGKEAARILAKLAEAVHYAHRCGVIHRDIKPQNILLDESQSPHLTDFGLAKRLGSGLGITRHGLVMGTPSYMSPEQASGRSSTIGVSSDVYSLGATLYHAIVGRPPFRADNQEETLRQVQHDRPVAPRELNSAIDRDLETICLKCLEKDRFLRYASAEELAKDLDRYLEGRPILARPVNRVERVRRWARRNPTVALLFGGLLVCMVGGMTVASILYQRAEQAQVDSDRSQDALQEIIPEPLIQKGHFHAQRGQWQLALECFEQALQLTPSDPVAVELCRLEALDALDQVDLWRKAVDDLPIDRPDSPHYASILLWKSGRLREQGRRDEADSLVAQSLDVGLPEDERPYARALIAPNSREASELLRQCVDKDPFNQRTNALLIGTLLFMGRAGEAKGHALIARKLFPDTAEFPMALAIAESMLGDDAASDTWIDEIRTHSGPNLAAAVAEILKVYRQARGITPSVSGVPLDDFQKFVAVLMDTAKRRIQTREDDQLSPGRARFVHVPSQAQDAFELFASGMAPSAGLSSWFPTAPDGVSGSEEAPREAELDSPAAGDTPPEKKAAFGSLASGIAKSLNSFLLDSPREKIQKLTRATEIHPEGTFYFMLGLRLHDQGRLREAEEAFCNASQSGAILPAFAKNANLYAALMASLQYHYPPRDPEGLRRAADYLVHHVETGIVDPSQDYFVIPMLLNHGKCEAARRACQLMQAQDPENPKLKLQLVNTEEKAGNDALVVDLLDKLIDEQPEMEGLGARRDAAMQRLEQRQR